MLTAIPSANGLIKEHGELAPNVAGKCARDSREAGDEISGQKWTKVMIESKFLLARENAE